MTMLFRGGHVVTMDAEGSELSGGWILAEDGLVTDVGGGAAPGRRGRRPGRLPNFSGLVNTHHPPYQTLTRTRAQQADLFTWLRPLCTLWSRIDEESEYAAARTGLAELALLAARPSSTTTTSSRPAAPGASSKPRSGGRSSACDSSPPGSSMDLGESDGGLPPDSLSGVDAVLAETERVAGALHETGPAARIQIAVAPCSPFSVTTGLMRESAELARRLGLLLHTHLAETVEEEVLPEAVRRCRPVEYLAEARLARPGRLVRPCVHLSDEDIAQFAATETGVAHCPTSNLRLGAGVAPLRELLDAGVRVGLGVDGSASNERGDLGGGEAGASVRPAAARAARRSPPAKPSGSERAAARDSFGARI